VPLLSTDNFQIDRLHTDPNYIVVEPARDAGCELKFTVTAEEEIEIFLKLGKIAISINSKDIV
jgi:hypothetical protein